MVQEAFLESFLSELGPAGQIARAILSENRALRAENARLNALLDAQDTLKGRSPAHWSFHVLGWELGEQTFWPKGSSQPKTEPKLRVYTSLGDGGGGAPYWDITRKRIIDRLLPLLPMVVRTGAVVEIEQVGAGPTSDQVITIHPP